MFVCGWADTNPAVWKHTGALHVAVWAAVFKCWLVVCRRGDLEPWVCFHLWRRRFTLLPTNKAWSAGVWYLFPRLQGLVPSQASLFKFQRQWWFWDAGLSGETHSTQELSKVSLPWDWWTNRQRDDLKPSVLVVQLEIPFKWAYESIIVHAL